MSRAVIAVVATLLLAALRRALPVILGAGSVPFTPGSVVVAYTALTKPPIEAVVTASLCGVVVDALSGMPLGVSSFALVVTLLVARLGVRFLPSARGASAFVFTMGFAMAQAALAATLLSLFGNRSGSLGFGGLVALGLVDGAAALVVFPVLHGVAVRFGVEERDSPIGERLSTRVGG